MTTKLILNNAAEEWVQQCSQEQKHQNCVYIAAQGDVLKSDRSHQCATEYRQFLLRHSENLSHFVYVHINICIHTHTHIYILSASLTGFVTYGTETVFQNMLLKGKK
jgi:hypothetical protein